MLFAKILVVNWKTLLVFFKMLLASFKMVLVKFKMVVAFFGIKKPRDKRGANTILLPPN